MTWHCALHGYTHGESPPCRTDDRLPRRLNKCSDCRSWWCDRVAAAVPGLTPPPCAGRAS